MNSLSVCIQSLFAVYTKMCFYSLFVVNATKKSTDQILTFLHVFRIVVINTLRFGLDKTEASVQCGIKIINS